MRKLALALSVSALALAAPAFADGKPAELATVIKAEQPHGKGSYSKLVFHLYDAQLWTDGAWSYDAPFALVLIYAMDFSGDDIAKRSLEQMDEVKPLDDAAKASYASLMAGAFPDVKDGDRITALYKPGKGVTFYHNGKLTKSIASQPFAQAFLDIWFSDNTTAPGLRRKLLANG